MVNFSEIVYPPLRKGYPVNLHWDEANKRLLFVNSHGTHVYSYLWTNEEDQDSEIYAVHESIIENRPDNIGGKIHFIIPTSNRKDGNEFYVSIDRSLIVVKWDPTPVNTAATYQSTFFSSKTVGTWYSKGFVHNESELIVVQHTGEDIPPTLAFLDPHKGVKRISNLDLNYGSLVFAPGTKPYPSSFYYEHERKIYRFVDKDLLGYHLNLASIKKKTHLVDLETENHGFDVNENGLLFIVCSSNTVLLQHSMGLKPKYCKFFISKLKEIHSIALKGRNHPNTFFVGGVDEDGRGKIIEVQFSE